MRHVEVCAERAGERMGEAQKSAIKSYAGEKRRLQHVFPRSQVIAAMYGDRKIRHDQLNGMKGESISRRLRVD